MTTCIGTSVASWQFTQFVFRPANLLKVDNLDEFAMYQLNPKGLFFNVFDIVIRIVRSEL